MQVPLMDIASQNERLRPELEAAIRRCLDHNGFCLGPEVEAFEKEFAEWSASRHAIGFNSGTSALHVGARLLDIGPGDEVITTPMTFVSTCWAISYVGAKPVFADIDEETMNLDPGKAEAAITDRTKALFLVHLYGLMAPLEPFEQLCTAHSISLLEDAAQSHGAKHKERRVGSGGRVTAYSFYPGKNIGALGEGGALTTSDDELASRAKLLRNHGSPQRYVHTEIGYNYRMEGIQAAVLRVKLARLSQWTARRRELAAAYRERLGDLPLRLPPHPEGSEPVYHLFVVRHPERDQIAQKLSERGIGSAQHYPIPLHLQQCYSDLGYAKGDFPIAEKVSSECLSLPLFPEMTDEQLDYVCESLKACFD